MDLTALLNGQLSGDDLTEISHAIGADKRTTGKAASAALPLLFAALARNASQPEGAESLLHAVERDHDGSVLDDFQGLIGNPAAANGAGILGHVLGAKRPAVENQLAQQTGLDAGSMGQLMEMLAPLVMGAVGKTQREENLDASGLAAFLGGQREAAQQSEPDVMGVLNNLLDTDGDGSALDDLGRIAGALFGGR